MRLSIIGNDNFVEAPKLRSAAPGDTVTITHRPAGCRYDLLTDVIVEDAWPLRDGGHFLVGYVPEVSTTGEGMPLTYEEHAKRYGRRLVQVRTNIIDEGTVRSLIAL